MGGRRRWSVRPHGRGEATAAPAVLRLAAGPTPRALAQRHVIEGQVVIATRRTRVYLDRDAWEQVPPLGVYVQWVVPTNGEPAWIWAMTRAELEDIFGEVTESKSWEQYRCWHFPTPPEAIDAFRVLSHGDAASVSPANAAPAPRASTSAHVAPAARSHAALTASPRLTQTPVKRTLPVPDWARNVEDEGHRHVLAVLERNGVLEETEAIALLGTARSWRKLTIALDALRASLPFDLETVPTETGSALRKVPRG